MYWERSDINLGDEQIKLLRDTHVEESVVASLLDIIHPDGMLLPSQLPGGTFARSFKLLNPSRDPDLVLRLSIHPNVSTQSLHLEQWVCNEALARGFPTPRIVHVDTSRVNAPYPYQVIEYVDGVPLRAASEDLVRKVLSQLGAALSRLHSQPVGDRFGRVGLGTMPEWDMFWSYGVQSHIDYCLVNNLITDDHSTSIYEWLCTVAICHETPSLLHGDLSYDNVLIDGSTQDLKSVIDWEDAVLGDPIFELAGLATFHPLERHASFIDSYYAGHERPSDFEYRFWVYYLRIALAKAVHRHRFGYPDEPVYRNNPDIVYQAANTRISLALSKLKDLT